MAERTGHIPYTGDPLANHRALVSALQQVLSRIDHLETNPTIRGDLDMSGGRITNVGLSRGPDGVPNRGELIANGLYVDAKGQHVAHSDLVVRGNIRSRAQARDDFDLVPFWQLKQLLQIFANEFALGTGTLTLTSGQNDDVQIGHPSRTIYEVTGPTADFSVSGFVDDQHNRTGRFIVIVNPTGWPMTIIDRSNGASVATNRIATNKGWDMETQTDGVVILCYVSSVWRVLATVL